MTEIETRLVKALDALNGRLERMTTLYQDMSYQLRSLKAQEEITMSRMDDFETTLKRLEKALKRFQELS